MIELKNKAEVKDLTRTCELIKGDFSPEEASEIVHDLFSKKINFHEVKSFSKLIREGVEDHKSAERIVELKADKKSAKELINEAEASGKTLRITSTVHIELI
jgi:hypothetical protein